MTDTGLKVWREAGDAANIGAYPCEVENCVDCLAATAITTMQAERDNAWNEAIEAAAALAGVVSNNPSATSGAIRTLKR